MSVNRHPGQRGARAKHAVRGGSGCERQRRPVCARLRSNLGRLPPFTHEIPNHSHAGARAPAGLELPAYSGWRSRHEHPAVLCSACLLMPPVTARARSGRRLRAATTHAVQAHAAAPYPALTPRGARLVVGRVRGQHRAPVRGGSLGRRQPALQGGVPAVREARVRIDLPRRSLRRSPRRGRPAGRRAARANGDLHGRLAAAGQPPAGPRARRPRAP